MKKSDFIELNDFSKNLLELAEKKMPKETKKFLKREAKKLNKLTKKNVKTKIGTKTGNYVKGWQDGKVYRYNGNEMAVRVYNSSSHAHLIEDGHRQVTKDGKEVGFVKGKHILGNSTKEFKTQFYNDLDGFIDDLLDEGL